LPWFAALFLRAFFLRDFLAMLPPRRCVLPPFGRRSADGSRPADAVVIGYRSQQTALTREGRTVAEEIRAEMVANVWKVVKSAGDSISEGDQLVILESMKMEIPVIAESDGVLREMAVNEGDVVQEGDLIAIIE
jgi:acetyl-CoA carboxylase biotin carboxyl carrier protein